MSTFGDQVFQFGGVPVGPIGQPPFGGKAFFVDYENGSDDHDGLSWAQSKKTLSGAVSAAVSNRGDIIFIDPYSTVVETAMVTISKNSLTIVGGMPPYGHYGQGAKVQVGVTTAATDIATIYNTGIRNKFIGIKFINANTVTEGLYCVVEAGEYAQYFNCDFYKSTDLDVTTASECLNNGDSPMFYQCTFGSSANIVADNVIRPNMSFTATITGKKARDVTVRDCIFWSKCGGTEHVFMYGANATDVERMLLVENCKFINSTLSAADPAHAIGFGAAQTQGAVLVKDCATTNCTLLVEAAVGITVAGAVPTFATTGVGVNS